MLTKNINKLYLRKFESFNLSLHFNWSPDFIFHVSFSRDKTESLVFVAEMSYRPLKCPWPWIYYISHIKLILILLSWSLNFSVILSIPSCIKMIHSLPVSCIGSQVLLSFYCLGVLDTTVRHQAAERGALHLHHRPQVRYLH